MKHLSTFHCMWIGLVCIGPLLSIATYAQVVGSKPKNELAMSPGVQIAATTNVGTITITARENFLRSYSWDGATRSVFLTPRSERWYGSMGIYQGGHYCGGADGEWDVHNGIDHGTVEEGQQHFKTTREAVTWLHSYYLDLVYRDDGLVVGWSKVVNPGELDADVWQILVAGKKPLHLPGSQNNKILVRHIETETAPLVQAVQKSDLPRVRLLLAQGCNPNVKSSVGYPVLVIAARSGSAPIVNALLGAGAKPNIRDAEGSTALLEAVIGGQTAMVNALLAKKTDVNQAYQRALMKGMTPLMVALMMRRLDIFHLLLDKGADVKVKSEAGLTCLGIAQTGVPPVPDIVDQLKKAGAQL